MKIEISNGELIDKLTILELKKIHVHDSNKLVNIDNELSHLMECFNILKIKAEREILKDLISLKNKLFNVNQKLWNIEDAIREKEATQEFDPQFIELARSVYIVNDERASIKKEINILTKSKLIEEKSYKKY